MRSAAAKALRRSHLLSAARELFEILPYAEIRVLDIVRATGLAKGTFYLYFAGKEALFLELLLTELESWFAEIRQALAASSDWTGPQLAHLLCCSLSRQLLLRRLLSLLHTVLEVPLAPDEVLAFKTELAERMAPMALALEAALPMLAAGDGRQLLLNLHALVIGLEQSAVAGPVAAELADRPQLQFLMPHFESELKTLLIRLLAGWRAVPHTSETGD